MATEPRTIAIIGSRGFRDPDYYIDLALEGLGPGDTLVSGGARNVDQKAELRAAARGLTVLSLRPVRAGAGFAIQHVRDGQNEGLPKPPSFPTFRDAALHRNWLIAVLAVDGVTAVWDGTSTGTAHGIACAIRHCRPLRIWMPGDS